MNRNEIAAALTQENLTQALAALEAIYGRHRVAHDQKGELDIAFMIIHLHQLAQGEGGFFAIGQHLIKPGNRLKEAPAGADLRQAGQTIERIFAEWCFSDQERCDVTAVLAAFHHYQLLNRRGHFWELAKDLA